MDPITRQEQYLNAIAGGDNDVPETPQTREEWFLNQILENGDTKLAAPTTAGTSGQVLTSDGNGGQVWATVGSGSIVVDNTLSVEGAAADAKKAGDEIGDLKSAIGKVEPLNRVTSLDTTELACGTPIETVGTPVYVDDVTDYPAYNLSAMGWYIFARIAAKSGTTVSAGTSVTGAAGYIATVGAAYVDVAVKFEVAAISKKVTVTWATGNAEAFIFKATDLAVRNLDYRTTFYLYDLAPFVTWSYALTSDETFVETKTYYKLVDEVYTKAAESEKYTLTADEAFVEGKSYYTESSGVYTKATVTAGETIPENTYYELATVTADTYYNHSKVTFAGMTRNVTYKFDETIDCPIEITLPEIENDGYGAWFEIQLRYDGSYSCTLLPPTGVKIGTVSTQNQTAGINVIDLQYTDVGDVQMWSLLNTHSNIPA